MYHLRIGTKHTGLTVRPDERHPHMYRIHHHGRVSDMLNLTRAKDAAFDWVLPPKRGRGHVQAKWITAQTSPRAGSSEFRNGPATPLAATSINVSRAASAPSPNSAT